MTKLVQRGQNAAASLLVPSIVLLALALALLAIAMFPAAGLAAEEEGGPIAPELSFPQAPLELGKATLGTESTAVSVTVHNSGTVAAAIDKVTVEGGDAGEFKLNGSNCGWIEPGQDCQASVSFAPGSAGLKQTDLVVQLKEFPVQTMPISGTGVPAQLSFNPGSYDFGIQRVNRGESSVQMQLTNSGEAMVMVGSIGIGGPNANNFWTSGGDCWNGRQLQPAESCNVQVSFNPWEAVAYEAELRAYAPGGATFGATLTGFGGRAQVEPTSMPSELGAVTVGTAGPVETIVFVNHGNLPGNFFIGIVAGGDSGSFRLLDESCSIAPVAPGASCTAHVRFEPQSAGPKLARMALFGDDDNGTGAILSGEGIAAAVTLAPASFDFGTVAAGAKSVTRDFAVRNEGSTALDLDRAAIVGADLDQFALAGDECTGATLAPGAECLVRVRFTPDSAGAKTARLRVSGDAGAFVAGLGGSGERVVTDDAGGPAGPSRSATLPGGSPAGDPRPGRRRGHRRFSRGATVSSVRGRALRRADIRARTLPR